MMRKLAISATLVIFFCNHLVLASDFRFSPRPNRAHLIKWRHWEKQSLEDAKKEGKPILLSLSAVWCHWCHVMDETTYSATDVIDFINSNLIPIRVDANMRPDIDNLYNQGGWPSTVVLTPKGEIVQGGNYISQESMIAWLSDALEVLKEEKKGSKEKSETIKNETRGTGRQMEGSAPDVSDIGRITNMLESSYDKRHGGFGLWQKFPNPDAIDFLLSGYLNKRTPELMTMISTTLEHMSEGGIYDRVDGGFFRYSTQSDWSAPHYEKMLDLNAAIIKNYASAYMVFGNSNYKKVLNKTITYLEKHLYDKKMGAFYGSQDAEEDYYRKTERAMLKPPHVDSTIYADSNAQMITGLIAAYGAMGEKRLIRMAERATDFIMLNLYSDNEGTYHYYFGQKHLSGLLSDNVLFGLALIDLYTVTGETRYLSKAEDICRLIINKFYDKTNRRFIPSLETTIVNPAITGVLSHYNTYLSNNRAVIFLNRLYYHNGDEKLESIIDSVNSRLRAVYEEYGPSAALYGTALRWRLEAPFVVTIIARDKNVARFLLQVNKIYIPQKVVRILSLKRERDRIRTLGYPVEEAAYVCSGKRCSPAFTEPDRLTAGIRRLMENLNRKDKMD
ncbi:MAG: thioredoxin domain-containing protein [Dissulfurispiraceae bacterium]